MRRISIMKERIYSKDRKRRRALRIPREVTGHLKTMMKQKGDTKKSREQFTATT
jgi:hypothetical protein